MRDDCRSVTENAGEVAASLRCYGEDECRREGDRVQVLIAAYRDRCLHDVFHHGARPLLRTTVVVQRRRPHSQTDQEECGEDDDVGNEEVSFHSHTEPAPDRRGLELLAGIGRYGCRPCSVLPRLFRFAIFSNITIFYFIANIFFNRQRLLCRYS